MSELLLAFQTLPQVDPLPLPAEPWIFLFLLYLTFTLHMIAVSITIGGCFMLALSSFIKSEQLMKTSRFLANLLPVTLAFSITLGVAPLLFIQVLFGQIFFTTTILMGWWWLLALVFLLFAYYGLYLYQHKSKTSKLVHKWIPVASFVLLLLITFIFVLNFKLFFRYEEWGDIYKSGAGGWFLNIDYPRVIPGWMHYILSAVASGGMLVVIHGWARRKNDFEYSLWAVRWGGVWFALPTLLQFAVGYWLIRVLPRDLIRAFMFGSGYETAVFFAGISLGTLAALLILWAAWKRRYGLPVITAIIALAGSMAFMTLKRAAVRDKLLADLKSFSISAMEVRPQWDTIVIFIVLLGAGLTVVAWMLSALVRGKGTLETQEDQVASSLNSRDSDN